MAFISHAVGVIVRGGRSGRCGVVRRRCSVEMKTKTQLSPMDSGYISTLPKGQQAAITLAMSAGVALAALALNDLVVPVLRNAPLARPASRLAGLIYVVAGFGHFKYLEGFCDVYPEKGAWGWYYLPGSPEFHVVWTGVVEIVAGLAVLCGDLPFLPEWAGPLGGWALFLLTVGVTPANLYSVTHGRCGPARDIIGPDFEIPPAGHVFRMLLQPGLISIMWSLATGYR